MQPYVNVSQTVSRGLPEAKRLHYTLKIYRFLNQTVELGPRQLHFKKDTPRKGGKEAGGG